MTLRRRLLVGVAALAVVLGVAGVAVVAVQRAYLVERLVTQALVGLTSNAVRHTPPGTPVVLRLGRSTGHATIEVADAGPGIPPEHLSHAFERFHRVDRGRAAASGGTGLGLALVEAVARAHGGTVAAASEPGRGAVFTLRLPLDAR